MTFTREQLEYFANGGKPAATDLRHVAQQFLLAKKREDWLVGEVQRARDIARDLRFQLDSRDAQYGMMMSAHAEVEKERSAWVRFVEGRLLTGIQSVGIQHPHGILEDLEFRICNAHGKPPVEEP